MTPPSAASPALDAALPGLYDELRRIARRQLDGEREGHTLDSVALVAEAYERLARQPGLSWASRPHLLALCARTMRQVLVDHARARAALKRGGNPARVTLGREAGVGAEPLAYLLALDEALGRLGAVNEEALRVVEARFFAGLSVEETAEALGLSVATTRRRWSFAKVWLREHLVDR